VKSLPNCLLSIYSAICADREGIQFFRQGRTLPSSWGLVMALLEVKNLRIEYPSRHGIHAAVKSLSFSIERGEIVGVVGESGAGKSTVGNAVIDLLSPPGQIASGDVYLDGEKISGLSPEQMRKIRGSKIGFIFQDPMTSLNPLFTVEQQLTETIVTNLKVSKEDAYSRALSLMEQVGIPQPELRIKQYPHQFSGGMRQEKRRLHAGNPRHGGCIQCDGSCRGNVPR